MQYIFGQAFGLLATLCCIIVPFFSKKWQMLATNIAINLFMMLNFTLIGEISTATWLCALASIQSVLSLVHTLRDTPTSTFEQILFWILYPLVGLIGLIGAPGFVFELSLRNLIELLPICGSLLSMSFVFTRDEQKARYLLLATSTVWASYAAIMGATSFFAEFISILVDLAAILKYRKRGKAGSDSPVC